MPFIDPEIFHRFEEKRAFQSLKFDPVTVDILEINLFADSPPSILTFPLHPKKLEAWIEEKSRPVEVCNSAKSCGALRLILGPYAHALDPHSQIPIEHAMQKSPLPFSREIYKLLCDGFHLPRATSGMLINHTATSSAPHFQIHNLSTDEASENPSQSIGTYDKIAFLGITMKCRGSNLVGMRFSAVISHCRTSNITNAVLLCHSPEQAARIGDAVIGVAQVATHPAIIPTLLCTIHLDILSCKVDTTWGRLFDIEAASGQSEIPLGTDCSFRPIGNCDDPSLSKKAIGATQFAIAWETYAQSDVESVASINEFVALYNPKPGTIQVQQTQVLKEYLSLVSQRGSMVLHAARHLKARAEVQVNTICNHLAHKSNQINLNLADSSRRIAMDARKDSSMMNSIAVLTMVFLPATFIAALFATPGVAQLDPSQELYWGITLPLTALVLLIWTCWTWANIRKVGRYVDRLMPEKSGHGLDP